MTGWPAKGTLVGDEMAEFCDLVTKMSGGRIELMPTYEGEVLAEDEQLEGLASGICEVGYPWPGFYFGIIPEAFIESGLPFSIKNAQEYHTLIWERGWADILRDAYAGQNLFWCGPLVEPAQCTLLKEPIQSLADLEGRKLRMPGGSPAKVMEAVGAKIVMVPYTEVYTALMMGTVDGACAGSIGEMYDLKLHEFAKYRIVPSHLEVQVGPVVVNMNAWNSLTEDLQEILIAATVCYSRKIIELREGDYATMAWGEIVKAGGEVCELPKSDYPKLHEAANTIWEEATAETPACAQMIEILKEYMCELGYLE